MEDNFNKTEQNNRISDRGSRLSRLFSDDFIQSNQESQSFTPQQKSNPSLIVKNPKTYEDVRVLIDHLKRGEQVLINFNDLNQNTACRILDFMSGAVYALNGSIQEVEKNLFVFAPQGVTIYMNN